MIEFEAVSKTYPGGSVAVEEFSLVIPSRTAMALVGSSGSGKTTLLRMVNRMVDPTSGRVLIDGDDVRARDAVALRRSIGYVLQAGGLLPHRSVLDNVATVLRLNGQTRASARAKALELMERVGLDPALGRRYPGELHVDGRAWSRRGSGSAEDGCLIHEHDGSMLLSRSRTGHRKAGQVSFFVHARS